MFEVFETKTGRTVKICQHEHEAEKTIESQAAWDFERIPTGVYFVVDMRGRFIEHFVKKEQAEAKASMMNMASDYNSFSVKFH